MNSVDVASSLSTGRAVVFFVDTPDILLSR